MTSSVAEQNCLTPMGKLKPLTKSQQLASHLTERAELGTRLSYRYGELLRSEKYCDCQFLVGNMKIPCHKLILTAASPVFEAMFYGPIRESRAEIIIDDISPEIFQLLLAYIYAGCLNFEEMTLEEVIELYYSAEKYLLNDLIQDCLVAVTLKLRFENILPALELSVCMNVAGLLDICMSFFTRCCLGDSQYMCYLKANYNHHVSKDCMKAIIAANKAHHSQLLWFVFEWCQQECQELGLEKSDCALIIDDLDFDKSLALTSADLSTTPAAPPHCQTLERTYYKACRPFTLDSDVHSWKCFVKCQRFISLHGLVLHSRLIPGSPLTQNPQQLNDYNESLVIEIRSVSNTEENGEPLVWRHHINKQPTKYNCDLNVRWSNGVVLSPDTQYEIKLIWNQDAFGAEYPCSLMASTIDGFEFTDNYNYFGSLLKGLSYVNLV